jgi:hypothetical protein
VQRKGIRNTLSTLGRAIFVSRSRKLIICVPVCPLHTYPLCLELSTPRLRKCISCFPRFVLHLCHTCTLHLPKRPGSDPAAQRGILRALVRARTHTHTDTQIWRHHPASKRCSSQRHGTDRQHPHSSRKPKTRQQRRKWTSNQGTLDRIRI